jgi:hypothetical protein
MTLAGALPAFARNGAQGALTLSHSPVNSMRGVGAQLSETREVGELTRWVQCYCHIDLLQRVDLAVKHGTRYK